MGIASTKLAFVDVESTGLDPDRHEIWEVGLIVRDEGVPDDAGAVREDAEYVWQLPVNLGRADAVALNIGRFHERRWPDERADRETDTRWVGPYAWEGLERAQEERVVPDCWVGRWCRRFAELTWGAHLVGAVPSFDEERLRRLLRANGACPGWHYHLIDVEALAVGWLCGGGPRRRTPEGAFTGLGDPPALPWDSRALSRAVGVEPDQYDAHTALGDARWAKALFDAIMGGHR